MVRSSSSSSSLCLRLMLPVCFFALKFSAKLHPCSAEIVNATDIFSAEEVKEDYNAERYLRDDPVDLSFLFILVPVLSVAVLIYVFETCSNKKWYEKLLKAAKEQVKRDIANELHGSRNMPPRECTYETVYTTYVDDLDNWSGGSCSRPERIPKTVHKMITLKFSKIIKNNGNADIEGNASTNTNRNGWYITGNGNDDGEPCTVTEGKLCATTGRAYWVEKKSHKRFVINEGKFETPHFESFVGTYLDDPSGQKKYDYFKKSGTTTRHSQEPSSSSRPQRNREIQAARYGGPTNPPRNPQPSSVTYGEA